MNKINLDILASLIWAERQKFAGYRQAQQIRKELHESGFTDIQINREKKILAKKLNHK